MTHKHLHRWSVHFAVVLLLVVLAAGCTPPDPSLKLKPLADAYAEVWSTGDLGRLDAIVDVGFKRHSAKTGADGLDSLKRVISNMRNLYPDFKVVGDDAVYSEGKMASRWTWTGTHSGAGNPALQGKKVRNLGSSFFRVVNGKLVEEWVHTDNLSVMTQLGFTVAPPVMPEETAAKKPQKK
jgi:steroid delta-isomerase-like uncharacterized protein